MIPLITQKELDYLNSDAIGKANKSQKSYQPYLIDLVTLKRVYFQGLPLEISVDESSNFSTISSANRNLPLFHYNHGEDTVRFTISFFADIEEQNDVIAKVKWISSLKKVDGYGKNIHPVQLCFGELFKDSKFIVVEAPYVLRNPNRELGMLPKLASQDITLKRISEKNPTLADYKNIHY